MATSGTLYSSYVYSSDKRFKYAILLSWTKTATSIDSNTSTISYTISAPFYSINNDTSGVWANVYNITVSLNGTNIYTSSGTVKYTNNTTIKTGTLTVAHDSDGSKTMSASISAGISQSSANSTGSSSWALTTIPRASSISCASSMTYGNSYTLTISRASSSFTHNIYIGYNSSTNFSSTAVATGVGTSYSFTMSTNYATNLTGTSNYIYFKVVTYNGSTQIGSAISGKVTVLASSALYPTISSIAVASATNDSVAIYGGTATSSTIYSKFSSHIVGKSSVKVTPTVSAKYGASISTIKISNGSTSVTGTSGTFLLNSTSTTFTVTVTDSRGLSSSSTQTVSATAYSAPTGSISSAYRANSSGTADPDAGAYMAVNIKYNIYSLSSKNTKAIIFGYKLSTASSYTNTTYTPSNYSGTQAIKGISATTSSAYDIRVVIYDYFGACSTITAKIPSISRAINFYKNNGVAIGKMHDTTSSKFEVGWKTEIDDQLIVDGYSTLKRGAIQTITGVNTTSSGYFHFADITITGSWFSDPIVMDYTMRSNYGMGTLEIVFSNASTPASETLVAFRNITKGPTATTFYIAGSGANWSLYTTQISYPRMAIHDLAGRLDAFTVTWVDEFVTSLPSGYVACEFSNQWVGSLTSNGDMNVNGNYHGTGTFNTSGQISTYGAIVTLDSSGNAKTCLSIDGGAELGYIDFYNMGGTIRDEDYKARMAWNNSLGLVSMSSNFMAGNIYAGWHSTPIGASLNGELSNTTTISSSTTTTVSNVITIPAGAWVIQYFVNFAVTNGTGERRMWLQRSEDGSTYSDLDSTNVRQEACSSGWTTLNNVWIVNQTITFYYRLQCYQTSGSALELTYRGIRAVRIA